MYFCPLCACGPLRQGYSTLDSLKVHLDLFHCSLDTNSSHRQTATLRELEHRVETLLDTGKRQVDGISLENGYSAVENRKPMEPGLIQRYCQDYDLARAENEYLTRKLKDEKSKRNQELEDGKEKYGMLETHFRNLADFLETESSKQADGKKRLEGFMERILDDLERTETKLMQFQKPTAVQSMKLDEGCELTMRTLGRQPRSLSQPAYNSYGLGRDQAQIPLPNRLIRPSSDTIRPAHRPLSSADTAAISTSRTRSLISIPPADSGFDGSVRLATPAQPTMRYASLTQSVGEDYRPSFVGYFDEGDDGPSNPVRTGDNGTYEPYDLALVLIFRQLDAFELLTCAMVCRRWYSMARNPLVWRTVRLKNRMVSNQLFLAISTWSTQTANLTMENLKCRKSQWSGRRGVEVTENVGDTGNLESGLEGILQVCGAHLLFLKLVDCSPSITNRALWLVACYCKNVEKVVYISDHSPANAPSIWALGASCRTLSTLIVPPSIDGKKTQNSVVFDDEALLMIARCFPTTLKVLCIGGPHVTVTGLKHIAKSCQWLEALELDRCTGVTMRTAKSLCIDGLKSLQVLNFTHCDASPAALEYFHDHLPQLRSIRVVFSWKDFSTAKNLESFLADYQACLERNPTLKRTIRIEEQL